ncbi:MAG: branched-chain amino acid ABC transporter permease [Microbacterium sp.]|uniref:branched-chain amino acid ABC transporter permease n=1 Tax=Microbacterium sp. TaxID=51671 RepID=UPI000C5F9EA8|nr:branched-chain amino acid ABC transporter permease [Microbacterium sp.]MAY50672.1 branched-chain amino acid ABC transporter permease [Microbacterium sp.]HAS33138.1 branched-chain amino acid ABC transporter permease [Microbacterium sp.]HBR89410.1 branched-chain amino acid ABC transporter permease [Microbacterium sp.]HBS73639.1 branched-chain amino acid ABC transporter permease [Microbacterium sp.]|tara:strand:- start:50764 stop:51888 length:1125 start_codon:yes stop_codon:yes gene_type:complete
MSRSTKSLRRFIPLVIGVVLVAFMAVLPMLNLSLPGILPTPTYMPGTLALLSLCMVFAALALSYNLLLGTSGMLSFGHALYFGAGAYGLGIALEHLGVPLWPGVFIALIGGMVIALATGAVSMRVSGIPFAMVTLAFAQAGSVLVRRNSDITGGEEGLGLNTDLVPDALVGVVNTRNLYWLTLAILVVVYLVALWVDKSRLGHLARATRENEQRVRVLGLSPFTVRLTVFVIAAVLASLAGIAYMLLQSGTVPRAVSADLTITILVMVVLGGVGFRWGAIVGGVLYTLLDQRLTVLAGSEAITGLPDVLRIPLSEPLFLLGALFILVVMFLPGGIAGTVDKLFRRRRRSGRDESPLEEIDDAAAQAENPVEVRA